MDAATFDLVVGEARQLHPRWFATEADKRPTAEELREAEQSLGIVFPQEYREFLMRYGGGDFAFAVVYSVDPESDLNVVAKHGLPWLQRSDFVAVSDNGAGDYYGFHVEAGRSHAAVLVLDHETGELRETGHHDLYEFLVDVGLHE